MNYGLLAGGAMLAQSFLSRAMKGKMSELFSTGAIRFETVHQMSGRRRFRSPWLKDRDVADKVLEIVRSVHEVTYSCVNVSTGSLLIEYDENCSSNVDAAISDIEKSACLSSSEKSKKLDMSSIKTSANPREENMILPCNDSIEVGVSAKPVKMLNFKKMVGLAFLAYGAYRMLKGREFPAGPQLLWWGYHILNIGRE